MIRGADASSALDLAARRSVSGQWARAGILCLHYSAVIELLGCKLSWLHYGVLKIHWTWGNDFSKPGPSMARNRCYRLSHNTLLSMFQIDYMYNITLLCKRKKRNEINSINISIK